MLSSLLPIETDENVCSFVIAMIAQINVDKNAQLSNMPTKFSLRRIVLRDLAIPITTVHYDCIAIASDWWDDDDRQQKQT